MVAGDPPIFLRDDTGELYLCAIKDMNSGRIVGYSMDARMTASFTVAVLFNAIDFRAPARAIVYSDGSSGFRSTAVVGTVTNNGLIGPMGRVGASGGNAAMESFLALLQKNVLDRQRWASRDEFRLAIITCIDKTYDRRRRNAPWDDDTDRIRDAHRRRSRGLTTHRDCLRLS